MYGWSGKLLRVDVSKGTAEKEDIAPEILKNYIGGRGLGTKLLYDEVGPDVDGDGPGNKVIFSVGPLAGTPMGNSRLSTTTKAPKTGFINDHSLGGFFPAELRYAGYDSLVVQGQAEEPVYIFIDGDEVSIRSAKHLWGMNTFDTHRALWEELDDPAVKILCIGPAGENKVINAVLVADLYHTTGRGGTGYVMGAKKVKAVCVRGGGEIKIADPDRYMQVYDDFWRELDPEECLDLFHRPWGMMGSVFATDYIRTIGGLLSNNDQFWSREYNDRMRPTTQLREKIVRPHACYGCALPSCSQLLKFRDGKIGKSHSGGPMGLGAQFSISNMDDILDNQLLCQELGVDVWSGLEFAWAIEAYEKGLITKEDTGGLELRFEDPALVAKLIRKMAYREGTFGNILAEGLEAAADRFGGKEFASCVKGLTTTTVPARSLYGMALNYAVNDTGGDHTRVYPPYPPVPESIPAHVKMPFDIKKAVVRDIPDEKGRLSKWTFDTRAVINSLTMCTFTSRGRTFSDFSMHAEALSAATGVAFTAEELYTIGERICNLERSFNVMNADASRKDDRLPRRMTDEAVNDGGSIGMKVPLQPMLDEYYAARNWNPETGRPTKEKLAELGLDGVIRDFEAKGVWQ